MRLHAHQQPEILTGRTHRNTACIQCATSRGLPCERRTRSSKNRDTGNEDHTVAEARTNANSQTSQPEKSPTRSLAPPATLLADDQNWVQDPQFWDDLQVNNPQGRNLLETVSTYDNGTYGVHPSDQLGPRHLSIINWLSPDESILQEWANQLSVVPDGGIFPTPFTVPDGPSQPGLLCTDPPLGWAPTSESTADQAQVETPAAMTSRREPTDHCPPETLMDEQSSHSSQTTSGKYYAGGVAWRAPFQSRYHRGQAVGSVDRAGVATSATPTKSAGSVASLDGATSSLSIWLAEDVYARIVRGVQEETQTTPNLPPLEAFRFCVHLYFKYLHPTFPFLRKATFINEKPHWILPLAVAGVGAVYLRSLQGLHWKDAIMQALDRVLSRHLYQFQRLVDITGQATNIFGTENQMEDFLLLIQAKVLHLLCMLHSSTTCIAQRAMFERANLVQWCSYLSLVPDSADVSPTSTSGKDTQQWVWEQSSLRTGMMIWLLDSMVAYELNCIHLMTLGDIRGWLPCPEMAWDHPSPENIAFADSVSISLLDALDLVYIEKRLPPQLSQFSQILLIHGIYRRTTEVANQSRMRLLSWSPTDSVQISSPDQASNQQTWPPSNSIFVKWRNAACDALDVLHCAANSRAAESYREEPTIFYLHLARLILLAPFAHFQTLAQDPRLRARSELSVNTSHQDRFEHARSQVFQWAIRDQFKARLSVIHAGALLWHVRRFSTDSFIEPFGEDDAGTDQSDAEPRLIYLDRPLDDELVQMYIRMGDKVSAQLKGVGDITSDGAPVKILKQGFYLLAGEKYPGRNSASDATGKINIQTWHVQQIYAATIRCLIEAS
ncbi:hypothetical protein ZTR_09661 [Talaromyces verruculosus]|nr:hypothetical protein ZTR_09661 [Talaromyces verruculosus]